VRDLYHEELDAISASLVEMANLVGAAMCRATSAILDADLTLAESVIEADETIDALYRETDGRVFNLMARQQPVAGDLRILVTSLRMVADLERMGDLALHIAKVARLRYPASAVPEELRPTIARMGEIAERIAAKAGRVIAEQDVEQATQLEDDDDEMDALHRKLFQVLLDPAWPHGVEPAIDITLTGRYYERFADHAVSVARRVVYLVTGQRHEPPAPAVLVRES
jgi:phosphate transport system protein